MEHIKACWVWGLQEMELHLRGPSTSRQKLSGAPWSLEEDLDPSAKDQRPLERPWERKEESTASAHHMTL